MKVKSGDRVDVGSYHAFALEDFDTAAGGQVKVRKIGEVGSADEIGKEVLVPVSKIKDVVEHPEPNLE